jgi:putative oxidoreductase
MPGLWPNITLALLRIVGGLMFMQHGAMKFFGVPLPGGMPAAMPVPKPFTLLWFAGALELVGGFLVAAGLFTRPVAFLLSGEMAVAYFTVHARQGFFPLANQGEPAVLFCFIFLIYAAIGGGRYSLDHLFFHRPAPGEASPRV